MPVFTILVFLGAALLWLLLSFIFKPLGKFAYCIWKDAADAIANEDENTKEDKRSNEK